MLEGPDELLARPPALIALQSGRENLQVVQRTEWMHSPTF